MRLAHARGRRPRNKAAHTSLRRLDRRQAACIGMAVSGLLPHPLDLVGAIGYV